MIKNNYNYGMNINIEEYNSVAAFLPGLYKFQADGLFFQAMLGASDKALLIYNDHAPDSKTAEMASYKVKVRIPYTDIYAIVDEKIINNNDMSGLSRLHILLGKKDTGMFFYYFVEDKKPLKFFLAILKQNGFRVQNRKVDLAKE